HHELSSSRVRRQLGASKGFQIDRACALSIRTIGAGFTVRHAVPVVIELGMLRSNAVPLLENPLHLAPRVCECLQYRNTSILVGITVVAGEGRHEMLREVSLVLFSRTLGGRNDHAIGATECLDKLSAGAGCVHKHHSSLCRFEYPGKVLC